MRAAGNRCQFPHVPAPTGLTARAACVQVNHTLYLLQRGKVTAYTAQNGTVKRVNTITRGAVMNDECLFLDLPVAHSAVAEEDSHIWVRAFSCATPQANCMRIRWDG